MPTCDFGMYDYEYHRRRREAYKAKLIALGINPRSNKFDELMFRAKRQGKL